MEFEFLAMEAVLSTVISDYRDKAVALLDEVHRHLKRINSSTALKTSHQVRQSSQHTQLLSHKGPTHHRLPKADLDVD